MTTNLVVADPERSVNTICLAVSPAMKALGVINRCRIKDIPTNISYITAPPRMQLYIDCAAEIYGVFLKYVAPQDIHVYSVDEAFLDVTPYLKMYGQTAPELAKLRKMTSDPGKGIEKRPKRSPLISANHLIVKLSNYKIIIGRECITETVQSNG